MHTAIDCSDFAYAPREYPTNNAFKFVTVGRLTPKKDHTSLVVAFSKLKEQLPDHNLSLDIIGNGPDYAKIEAKITQLELADSIHLHGPLQHVKVKELLKQSDIFVLNSVTPQDGDEEGIPGSIMEAMAVGLPIVSTTHTGIPELVEHMHSGLLAKEYDINELTQMMQTLVSNRELWAKFTQNGKDKVLREFERETQTNRLFEIIKKLND
jgi:colanic acid/amylovoran biosynthesis glycosyltransferase